MVGRISIKRLCLGSRDSCSKPVLETTSAAAQTNHTKASLVCLVSGSSQIVRLFFRLKLNILEPKFSQIRDLSVNECNFICQKTSLIFRWFKVICSLPPPCERGDDLKPSENQVIKRPLQRESKDILN